VVRTVLYCLKQWTRESWIALEAWIDAFQVMNFSRIPLALVIPSEVLAFFTGRSFSIWCP
jgi:hypothetical protein